MDCTAAPELDPILIPLSEAATSSPVTSYQRTTIKTQIEARSDGRFQSATKALRDVCIRMTRLEHGSASWTIHFLASSHTARNLPFFPIKDGKILDYAVTNLPRKFDVLVNLASVDREASAVATLAGGTLLPECDSLARRYQTSNTEMHTLPWVQYFQIFPNDFGDRSLQIPRLQGRMRHWQRRHVG